MADVVRVRNDTRGTILADRARWAGSAWQRFRGLMFTDALPAGEGLVLEPCNSIHMFFMRYPIDVVFLSGRRESAGDRAVVGVVEAIAPWRMTRFYRGARTAVELPPGSVRDSGTRPGDSLSFQPVGPT